MNRQVSYDRDLLNGSSGLHDQESFLLYIRFYYRVLKVDQLHLNYNYLFAHRKSLVLENDQDKIPRHCHACRATQGHWALFHLLDGWCRWSCSVRGWGGGAAVVAVVLSSSALVVAKAADLHVDRISVMIWKLVLRKQYLAVKKP